MASVAVDARRPTGELRRLDQRERDRRAARPGCWGWRLCGMDKPRWGVFGQFPSAPWSSPIRAELCWDALANEVREPGHGIGLRDFEPGTEIYPQGDGEFGVGSEYMEGSKGGYG